jgi:hypothetical protein
MGTPMISFKIRQSTQQINDLGGMALVADLLKNSSIFNFSPIESTRKDRISDSDVIMSYLTLLCQGRTSYAAVKRIQKSKYLRKMMGIRRVPSQEILRQRFDDFGLVDSVITDLFHYNEEFLKQCSFTPTELPQGDKCVVLDIDVSPLDNSRSKKENVSCTYKMHDGFAPAFAYLGEEGYMIYSELRPGKQHCQNGMLEFLRESIAIAKRVLPKGTKIFVRLDSGNDAAENLIELLKNEDLLFLIKRNIRKESKEQWYDRAETLGKFVYETEFRSCHQAHVSHITPTGEDNVTIDVVVRASKEIGDKNGQLYLLPKYKVETYWNNLVENCDEVIELYHQHGTSEQFHSELKSDMGVERLPSGTFTTNILVLTLANFAYNLLRRIGVDMASIDGGNNKKVPVKRRRIKTVLQNIIYTACKWVKTGGKNIIYWGCDSPDWWIIKKLHHQYV